MLLIRSVYQIVGRNSCFRKMSSSTPPFLQALALSVSAVDRAGGVVRDIMSGGNLDIVEKTGADDLQTRADRCANDLICGSLKKAFPALAVIGEEGEVDLAKIDAGMLVKNPDELVFKHFLGKLPEEAENATFEDITVWVDPLDGTKEYTEGFLDHVTVLVGIALGKKAIGTYISPSKISINQQCLAAISGGVIHQPFWNYQSTDPNRTLGRTFYAVVGSGWYGNLEPRSPPEGERVVTSTRSHSTGLVGQVIEACAPTKVLSVGGAGHKVILLMEGQAHCYVFCSPGCKKWDTCGPEAILHTLGGKLTDIKGNYYQYHKDVGHVNEWGILATAKASDHQEYLNRIPDEFKAQVKDYFKKKPAS